MRNFNSYFLTDWQNIVDLVIPYFTFFLFQPLDPNLDHIFAKIGPVNVLEMFDMHRLPQSMDRDQKQYRKELMQVN